MKILEIIKNEVINKLNENYIIDDDRFSFSQNMNNSEFYNYQSFTSDYDGKISNSNIIIQWKVTFWGNQNGIENFIIDVSDIKGQYIVYLYDKHTSELMQQSEQDISNVDWKFIINNATLSKGGSLYITKLIFDFNQNTCMVNF